jgi:putative NADPH-quinone reductase
MARILILNGHPDPSPARLSAALAEAYARGARAGGHSVARLDVGALDLSPVASAEEFLAVPPRQAVAVQAAIRDCDHLVLIFPLWLGGAPAKLKAVLEQVFRYDFALSTAGGAPRGLLSGRSARLVVTMGMPAPIFRWIFGAHGLKALSRGVFWLSGFRPVRETILGGVPPEGVKFDGRWLSLMEALGRRAA